MGKKVENKVREIFLKYSRNNGDYIPDYNFDKLEKEIEEYYQVLIQDAFQTGLEQGHRAEAILNCEKEGLI